MKRMLACVMSLLILLTSVSCGAPDTAPVDETPETQQERLNYRTPEYQVIYVNYAGKNKDFPEALNANTGKAPVFKCESVEEWRSSEKDTKMSFPIRKAMMRRPPLMRYTVIMTPPFLRAKHYWRSIGGRDRAPIATASSGSP